MNTQTTVSQVTHGWKIQRGAEVAIRMFQSDKWELYAVDANGLECFQGYAGPLVSEALTAACRPHVEANRAAILAACSAKRSLLARVPAYEAPL
jgi:hypothetical protein